jgi:hypothetical protein
VAFAITAQFAALTCCAIEDPPDLLVSSAAAKIIDFTAASSFAIGSSYKSLIRAKIGGILPIAGWSSG